VCLIPRPYEQIGVSELRRNIPYRDVLAERSRHVKHRPELEICNAEGNHRRRVIVTHGQDVTPRGIDAGVNGALSVGRSCVTIHLNAVECELLDIAECHELWTQRARDEEVRWIGWIPRTDVAERIDDTMVSEDLIRYGKLVLELRLPIGH